MDGWICCSARLGNADHCRISYKHHALQDGRFIHNFYFSWRFILLRCFLRRLCNLSGSPLRGNNAFTGDKIEGAGVSEEDERYYSTHARYYRSYFGGDGRGTLENISCGRGFVCTDRRGWNNGCEEDRKKGLRHISILKEPWLYCWNCGDFACCGTGASG